MTRWNKLPSTYANRGMDFEAEIEATHEYYKSMGLALVHKRPTPIKIVHMVYKPVQKIVEAYFNKKSTVDFEGVFQGTHIEFDTKECKVETRFPLDYIEPHQINHLIEVEKHGGIGFFLIKFVTPQEKVFLVRIGQIIEWVKQKERKSIPRDWFDEYAIEVKRHGIGRWNYLPILQEVVAKANQTKGESA